jgi:membrane associated rhomboid family serine protease
MIPIRDDVPSRRIPVVTIGLITANLIVFLYEIALGPGVEPMLARFGTIPYEVMHRVDLPPPTIRPVYLTFLTSMFLHGGYGHIIGNMLFLWIFGDNVEDAMGRVRFIIFYLICGIVAGLSHALVSAGSKVPAIGASGAIAGVLGAYLVLYPRARVLVLIFFGFFIRPAYLPAIFVLGFWFIIQLFSGIASLPGTGGGGGVAWFAHIGGFIAGLALVKPFQKYPPVRRRAAG